MKSNLHRECPHALFQSLSGAVRTAPSCLLVSFPFIDPIVANSNQAAIVGECPTDGSSAGKPIAVIWPNSSAGAQQLPLPAGAQYCGAEEVNVNGCVLGTMPPMSIKPCGGRTCGQRLHHAANPVGYGSPQKQRRIG